MKMKLIFSIWLLMIILTPVLAQDTLTIHPGREDVIVPEMENDTIAVVVEDRAVVEDTARNRNKNGGLLERPKIEWRLTVGKVVWSVIILIIAFFIIKYLTKIIVAIAERFPNARLFVKRYIPFFRILSWTLIIYIVIDAVINPPIETIIALTASLGIAVGFASQDILKNFFGGLMILLDQPFQVGDKIRLGDHYGEVHQIGLRTVRVVTPDDNVVSIPNGDLMNQPVANANYGESNCQVVTDFFLPPGIDVVKAKRIAYRAAAVSRYVYLKKPIVIIVKNEIHQGHSLLKLSIKAYVLDLRYEFVFSSELTETVIAELLKHKLVSAEQLTMFKED